MVHFIFDYDQTVIMVKRLLGKTSIDQYWSQITDKDDALDYIVSIYYKCKDYNEVHKDIYCRLRPYIIVGINVGAKPNTFILYIAAKYRDLELLKLAFSHDADPDINYFGGVITHPDIAQIFIDYKYTIQYSDLVAAVKPNISANVLRLYIKHDPTLLDDLVKSNILHELASVANEYGDRTTKILRKANCIFNALSNHDAYKMLMDTDINELTPIQLIVDNNEASQVLRKLYMGKLIALVALRES